MKTKILAIIVLLTMVSSTFVASANIKQNDVIDIETSDIDDLLEIRIALYSHRGSPKIFIKTLDGFQWTVGNKSYKFTTYEVSDKDVLKGKLTTRDYDLFVLPAGQAECEKRWIPSIQNRIWKRNLANFIKNGGGFIGHCGGATAVIGMADKPETLNDIIIDRTDCEISRVKIFRERGLPFFWGYPILCQLSGKPEAIDWYAYGYFGGKDYNNESQWPGLPLDFDINRDSPIFDDFLEDKRRIYCSPGGSYVISDVAKDDVTVLARYPALEISDNESTQIHHWKYTGGIKGFIKGFFKAREKGIKNMMGVLPPSLVFAGDWEKTGEIVRTNKSNKAFMTMETYPNEHQGRVILAYGHPEIAVWWGGHMEDVKDTNNNNLFDGLYTWKDITPFEETVEDEMTYNWWIVRREAAWAGKVPDNDLPPVYGPSQVSDIYPYNQSSSFTITGNAETASIESEWLYYKESLDLFYRYRLNNESSWSYWKLYETDDDASDGWSWEFNAPDGTGHYQFYSLRHVEYEHEWLNETVPPGPDAIAYIKIE